MLSGQEGSGLGYTWFMYQMDISICLPKVKPVKPYLNLLRPFSLEIWMLILSSFFSYVIAFTTISTFWTKKLRFKTFFEPLIWMFSAMMGQSMDIPKLPFLNYRENSNLKVMT